MLTPFLGTALPALASSASVLDPTMSTADAIDAIARLTPFELVPLFVVALVVVAFAAAIVIAAVRRERDE